ncbi:MAG: nitroreductase [Deltaproteobacteria bacterium SG8_13]|nr:MAG: nitroreductase [Deltaproteobacteria bacterium SG8_13]
MEFKELVRSRRSCRSFEPTAVSEEQIEKILEAGQWAPSPMNLQPWEFVVVADPEMKTRIRQVGEQARQQVIDGGGPGWAKKYGMDFLEQAPVLIVVICNPRKGGLGGFFGQTLGAMQAACACVQNMMLAAADLGLGSLWFTFFDPEAVRAVLGVPVEKEVVAIVPIGQPAQQSEPPPRKAPRMHQGRYSSSD